MRVLVVEDDLRLATNLRRGFEESGIAVDVVDNGTDGLQAAAGTPFDVVVLDGMLPGLDGYQVSRSLRSQHVSVPILMLTARDSVEDRVRGLSAGADDYLVKPFAFAELLARVRALGRRHLHNRSSVLEHGPLRLDTDAHRVTVDGADVDLTAKEFAILEHFMHHPGRVLTRTQIEDHVWNYDFAGESNLVEVYIARLRRKLATTSAHGMIETLRGTGGYRLR
jgi:two-component system, OmpR family, response regulator